MSARTASTCLNCGLSATRITRTWCFACYQRWLKAGRPESGPPPIQNDSLERWRLAPDAAIDREPSDLDVGTAGEHLVCADLLLGGLIAFRTDQTCAYDVAVDFGGRLIRLQVKSTRVPRLIPQRETAILAYQWHVRRAGKGGRRNYGGDEFDLLALVGLDVRQVAYLPPSLNRTMVQIRPPGSTYVGKQFTDYPFARALHEIGIAS